MGNRARMVSLCSAPGRETRVSQAACRDGKPGPRVPSGLVFMVPAIPSPGHMLIQEGGAHNSGYLHCSNSVHRRHREEYLLLRRRRPPHSPSPEWRHHRICARHAAAPSGEPSGGGRPRGHAHQRFQTWDPTVFTAAKSYSSILAEKRSGEQPPRTARRIQTGRLGVRGAQVCTTKGRSSLYN